MSVNNIGTMNQCFKEVTDDQAEMIRGGEGIAYHIPITTPKGNIAKGPGVQPNANGLPTVSELNANGIPVSGVLELTPNGVIVNVPPSR
ncbi:MAG: hypothetical protein ICV55_07205 [Coleofasciculus sp. C3-bin4]|nr:hypothetical protein [Coleofasciculus sp. C3-bin4]